jgi:4-amino-4-deoxy-L-arabinose transferase-like glycosyltransferase
MLNIKKMTQNPTLWLGIGLLVLYLLLAAAATQILPFSRALDELYHLEYITFIKQHGRLPVTYEERSQITRADYPPLYHLLAAVLVRDVDVPAGPTFRYFGDSFRYQVIDYQTANPLFFFTEDMTPPYLGQFLVWQRGRWFSLFLSVVALVIVFVTLMRIPVGQKPLIALAGVVLLAFNPRFLIVMSSLNDDSLLALVAALYFLGLVEIIKKPTKWRNYLLLGVVVGVSVTVKYSMVITPLEVLVLLLVIAWRYRLGWLWALKRLAVVALLAIIFSSWWFGWNIWHLNTVAEDGWFVGLTRALFAGGYDTTLNRIGGAFSGGKVGETGLPENRVVGTFGQWVQVTFLTMWGYSIHESIPMFPAAYYALMMLLFVAAVGLCRLWRKDQFSHQWVLLSVFHVSIFLIIPILRFSLTRRIGETAQGRHILIPAATAIVALLAWGLAALLPTRWRGPVFAAIIAALIGWSGLHLYRLAENPPPLLPMRTLAQAAAWLPEPVNAQFGEGIELASYQLEPQPAQGRLNLHLTWRSVAAVKENYLFRVTVLNEAGQPVAEWVGHPGAGRLPTLAWDPGDSVFDRLALPLPNLPAGPYSVQVAVVDSHNQPLPGQRDGQNFTSLSLTQFSLIEPAVFDVGPTGATIWASTGPASATPFRYPATIGVVVKNPAAEVGLIDPAGNNLAPTTSAGGVFNFVIGPSWPGGEYRLQIDGVPTGSTLTVENWWPRAFELPADIAVPLSANFADQLYLRGYSLPQAQVKAGEAFPLTLYWQAPADKSPQANFIQFNNLLDSQGTLHGGYDRLPLEDYSTMLWAPGEVVIDGYAVPVEADAPPGQYYLDVGFYLVVGEAGVNLPLMVDGQMTAVTSVTIGPIEVVN